MVVPLANIAAVLEDDLCYLPMAIARSLVQCRPASQILYIRIGTCNSGGREQEHSDFQKAVGCRIVQWRPPKQVTGVCIFAMRQKSASPSLVICYDGAMEGCQVEVFFVPWGETYEIVGVAGLFT